MSIRAFVSRLLAVRRQDEIDADLAEEIEEHLRLAAQTKIDAGMSPDAAYAAARREFGNATLARESSRNAWRWPSLDAWGADLRFGFRMARKHRGSTLVAIASLGVAVGVTSAVVSLLSAIMHPTYPFTDSDRLAVPWARSTRVAHLQEMQISVPELRAWQRATTQISLAGFAWSQSVNVSAGGEPARHSASMVTPNLLSVLGAAPLFGRDFTDADARDDAPNAAIVTYDFWKEELGGRGTALATPLIIDREAYAIIGVMPPDFRMPILLKVKILLPVRRAAWVSDGSARSIVPIGRLAPGASIASTTAELTQLTTRFNDEVPADRGAWATNVQPLHEVSRGYVAKILSILLALATLVLLIACANVAILLLARVPARRQELMIRLALGAERRRLISQLLAESAWLAMGAAAVGAAVLPPVSSILLRLIDGGLAFEVHPPSATSVLIYPVSLAVATCLIFGLAPAVSAVRALREAGTLSGARTAGAVEQEWLRSTLLTAEIALSIVLMVSGWLMIETVLVVHGRPLGFEPRELVTARLLLDTTRYRTPTAQNDFYAALAARLSTHTELRDVTVSSSVPLGVGGDYGNYVTRDVAAADDKPDTLAAASNVVAPNYFDAMHIAVVEGRMFDGSEREPVVAVNETLARRLWPNETAIGKRLRVLGPMFTDGEAVAPAERRIVAVVPARRPSPTHREESWPNLYIPSAQHALRGMYVAVRASTPAAATAAIRSEVAALDPLLPIYGVKSIDELLEYWFADVHIHALIIDVLAGIGALLTLVGVYSVVAVFVSQRTREIGVRIAVGAQRRDVVRMVVRRTVTPTVIGSLLGGFAALAGARTLAFFLRGISPLDPRAFAGAAAVLLLVVLAAAIIPARRAARLDPLDALRAD